MLARPGAGGQRVPANPGVGREALGEPVAALHPTPLELTQVGHVPGGPRSGRPGRVAYRRPRTGWPTARRAPPRPATSSPAREPPSRAARPGRRRPEQSGDTTGAAASDHGHLPGTGTGTGGEAEPGDPVTLPYRANRVKISRRDRVVATRPSGRPGGGPRARPAA